MTTDHPSPNHPSRSHGQVGVPAYSSGVYQPTSRTLYKGLLYKGFFALIVLAASTWFILLSIAQAHPPLSTPISTKGVHLDVLQFESSAISRWLNESAVQVSPSQKPHISQWEIALYGKEYTKDPLAKRFNRLEKTLFQKNFHHLTTPQRFTQLNQKMVGHTQQFNAPIEQSPGFKYLETRMGQAQPTNTHATLHERLNAIETTVYGQQKKGLTVQERVDQLSYDTPLSQWARTQGSALSENTADAEDLSPIEFVATAPHSFPPPLSKHQPPTNTPLTPSVTLPAVTPLASSNTNSEAPHLAPPDSTTSTISTISTAPSTIVAFTSQAPTRSLSSTAPTNQPTPSAPIPSTQINSHTQPSKASHSSPFISSPIRIFIQGETLQQYWWSHQAMAFWNDQYHVFQVVPAAYMAHLILAWQHNSPTLQSTPQAGNALSAQEPQYCPPRHTHAIQSPRTPSTHQPLSDNCLRELLGNAILQRLY